MPEGIIIKGIGGFYYVKSSEDIFECKARGIFRKDSLTPLPGDRVLISVVDELKKIATIEEILPRDSQLVRPAVANVNQLITVIAVKSPVPDLLLLDKLLVTAEMKGLSTVICINKIDLGEGNEHLQIKDSYSKAGYNTVLVSSRLDAGFDELKSVLKDRVSVFSGQSGVGKSTILNRIMDSWVMETGDVSEKIERGKHTTRHAELVKLEFGGYIVDTPGFSNFELTDLTHEQLEAYYPEFSDLLGKCKFTGCSHISEPSCAVKEALKEGLIDTGRYERYSYLYNALKQNQGYGKSKHKLN